MKACLVLLVVLALPDRSAMAQPLVDHHQHLFSPALAALISPPPPANPTAPITAVDLIKHLDAAGIQRAAVLSTAYIFGQPARKVENDRDKVMADNDWTAAQVAQFPDRLIGFCGVNPLTAYALDEIARCAKNESLRHGLKLHLGNAVVDYQNRSHVDQLRRVFRAANDYRMAIVVHLRASISQKVPYGPEAARVFLNDILPEAPDVPVQIAHLAGAGGYEALSIDETLPVFIEALAEKDPRTGRLWFDVTTVATATTTPDEAASLARRIRAIGVERVLFGSDASSPTNEPRDNWIAFRRLPLTDAEFQIIAANVAPYMNKTTAFARSRPTARGRRESIP